MRKAAPLALLGLNGLLAFASSAAYAQQQTIQYDGAATDAQAAITCGFCSGEKYGAIFYALGGTSGLPASAFPFLLDNILVPIAGTTVTFNSSTFMFECLPSAGLTGMTGVGLEVYSGQTVPAGGIENMPTGAWAGENTVLGATSINMEYSIENPAGSGMWELRFNTIPIGVTISPPDTYVRVVVSVATHAQAMSASCELLSYDAPNISPFRDNDGRVGARRTFIRELANSLNGTPERWQWVEQITDPTTGGTINGDWVIRMQITPQGAQPDAGVPDSGDTDSGITPSDAGTPDTGTPDAGAPPPDAGEIDAGTLVDAGTGGEAPTITSISPSMGASASSTDVTVVGTNFAGGVLLKIGAIPATVRTVGGSTTILATVPMGIAAGKYDVVVTNPDNQSAILSQAYTVVAATVPGPVEEGGCGCTTARESHTSTAWLSVAGLVLLLRHQRRVVRR